MKSGQATSSTALGDLAGTGCAEHFLFSRGGKPRASLQLSSSARKDLRCSGDAVHFIPDPFLELLRLLRSIGVFNILEQRDGISGS